MKQRMISEVLKERYGKEVWVELGLQTVSDETAVRIHRGYALPVFEDAYRRLTDAGLAVIVHVILYLPGRIVRICCRRSAILRVLRLLCTA